MHTPYGIRKEELSVCALMLLETADNEQPEFGGMPLGPAYIALATARGLTLEGFDICVQILKDAGYVTASTEQMKVTDAGHKVAVKVRKALDM